MRYINLRFTLLYLFSGKNAYVLWKNRLAFGELPYSFVNPGSFTRILFREQMWRIMTFCSVSEQVKDEI